MSTRRIQAAMNVAARSVRFTPEPGVARNMTFEATRGDTLVWELSGGDGHTVFVTFAGQPPSPVSEAQPLKASGNATLRASIQPAARNGNYTYSFEVEGPGLPRTPFTCFWADDSNPTPMGGGVITDPPPG
jgi:plastocyanin